MRCLACVHRRTFTRAALPVSVCAWTGAQVAEFAFGDERGPEDPDACCPLTLERCLKSSDDRARAQAILGMIDRRHLLDALLETYQQGHRARLEGLYVRGERDRFGPPLRRVTP